MGRLAIGGVVGAVMGGIVGGVSGSVLVGSVVAMVCGVVPIVFKSVMPTVVRGVVVTVFRGVTVDVVAEGLFWVICLGFVGACIVGVVAVFTMGAIIGKVVGIGAVVGGAVVGGAVGAVIGNIALDAGQEPQRRRRGATAVDSNTVYVAQGYGHCVWAYDPKGNVWTRLPDCPQRRAGLAIVSGLLTAVGGETYDGIPTNTLVSLTESHWTQQFPPMPVMAYNPWILLYAPAVVCTGKHLVVVLRRDSRVHVMDTTSLKWSTASKQRYPPSKPSLAVCGTELYVLDSEKTVISCSLPTLLQSSSAVFPKTTEVWQKLTRAPVEDSTLTTRCGQLVAVGGRNALSEPVDTIHLYDPLMDSWHIIGYMPTARYDCLVATLPGDILVVIGGVTREGTTERQCNVVEVACPM